ncbi:MAG: PsiF family protein [Hyphomicrobium sp.]
MSTFRTIIAAALCALSVTGAFAATPAKPAKAAKVHSPESIACSQQADAKGLHGKERKAFRATCKKQLYDAKSTAAKAPDKKS